MLGWVEKPWKDIDCVSVPKAALLLSSTHAGFSLLIPGNILEFPVSMQCYNTMAAQAMAPRSTPLPL